jgi:serine/threonine protein phosphatase 1
MRTLAIGDIHGCLRSLDALLDAVAPAQDDTLIFLGDYIDRGPNSRGVVERVLQLAARQRVIRLQGNHEQMMLEALGGGEKLRAWLYYGGEATMHSYSPLGDAGKMSDVPDEHWNFMRTGADFFETPTHFFVHANAYPDLPLNGQPPYMLRWEKFNDPPPHKNGKIMVCGHTAQRNGLPRNIGHAVCIDTFAYGAGGWLSCLDATSGTVWQANEKSESRRTHIDDCRIAK